MAEIKLIGPQEGVVAIEMLISEAKEYHDANSKSIDILEISNPSGYNNKKRITKAQMNTILDIHDRLGKALKHADENF